MRQQQSIYKQRRFTSLKSIAPVMSLTDRYINRRGNLVWGHTIGVAARQLLHGRQEKGLSAKDGCGYVSNDGVVAPQENI